MKSVFSLLLAGLVALLLVGCSNAPMKDNRDFSAKRVGILNLFQDKPSYTKLGLAKDMIGEAELPQMHDYLAQKLIAELGKVGVQAQAVRDHLPLLRNQVDVILELQPRRRDPGNGIERFEEQQVEDGTNGMGFYYKSVLLTKTGPEAFVSLRAVTVKNEGGALVPVEDYDIYLREKINLDVMANSWLQSSESEQRELAFGMQRTIDNGIAQLLVKLGHDAGKTTDHPPSPRPARGSL